jgi:hypothetical protein
MLILFTPRATAGDRLLGRADSPRVVALPDEKKKKGKTYLL